MKKYRVSKELKKYVRRVLIRSFYKYHLLQMMKASAGALLMQRQMHFIRLYSVQNVKRLQRKLEFLW